ncbi:hypothetical protein SK128_013207, partial [Halocaridina rubra]
MSDFPVLRMPLGSLAIAMLISDKPCCVVFMGRTSLCSFKLRSNGQRVAVFLHMDEIMAVDAVLTAIANQTKVSPYTSQVHAITTTNLEIQKSQTVKETENKNSNAGLVRMQHNDVRNTETPPGVFQMTTDTRDLKRYSSHEEYEEMTTDTRDLKRYSSHEEYEEIPSEPSQVMKRLSYSDYDLVSQVDTSHQESPSLLTETKDVQITSHPIVINIRMSQNPNETSRALPPIILPKPGGLRPKLLPKPRPPAVPGKPKLQTYQNVMQVQPVIREELSQILKTKVPLPITNENKTDRQSDESYETLIPLTKVYNSKKDNEFMTDFCRDEKLHLIYLETLLTSPLLLRVGQDFKRVITNLYEFHSKTFLPLLQTKSHGSKRDLAEIIIKTKNDFHIHEDIFKIYSGYLNNDHIEELTEIFLKIMSRLHKYKHALSSLSDTDPADEEVIREANAIIHKSVARADNYLLIDSIKGCPFSAEQCKLLIHKGTVRVKNKDLSNKSHLMILNETHIIFAEKATSKKKNKYCGCIKNDTVVFEGLLNNTFTIRGIFLPGSEKVAKFKIKAQSAVEANRWVEAIKETIQKYNNLLPVLEQTGPS